VPPPLELFTTLAPPIDDIDVVALPAQHRFTTAALRHYAAPVLHEPER
jgi:hypothetical protein